MVIKQIYIDQSKKIINKYNKILNLLKEQEDNLVNNKKFILNLQKEISNIDGLSSNQLVKQQKLEELMIEYDIKINKLEQEIKPILEELENLKKQSKILYDKIMIDYSGYSETEIQEQIKKQLQM